MVEPAWAVADIATSGNRSEIVRRCFFNMVRLHHYRKALVDCALSTGAEWMAVSARLIGLNLPSKGPSAKIYNAATNNSTPSLVSAKKQDAVMTAGRCSAKASEQAAAPAFFNPWPCASMNCGIASSGRGRQDRDVDALHRARAQGEG